ncbi:MAG: 3-octaprenyl-4-hydroxybenzoate carboxy-lyase, partial [Gammaproteobacteria bacterium]|nr:3-octaprenyl-4-hydroxybenzoate carboxy-lyase [Gammaproteobacteria bacterium]
GFYNDPQTIDDLLNHNVGRVLDLFDIESGLVKRWKGGREGPRKPRPNAK